MNARLSWPQGGLWREPDFLRLWSGQTVSEFGSQITLLALPLVAILVLQATTFEVAVLSTVEWIPFLLLALPAGVWVDRLARRPVLIAADLGRAVILCSVPVAYWVGVLGLAQLYVVGFLAGSLTVFFMLAYTAYIPSLAKREQLVEANAKLEVTRSIAQTGGPALAGALVALVTAPVAILGDAVSLLVSGVLIGSIRHREARRAATGRALWPELRAGLGYVWRTPILRANVYSAGLANFAYGLVWAILIVYAVRMLGLGAAAIGLILALGQAGGIVGALLARPIADRFGIGVTMISATALCGPAMLLVAVAPESGAVPFVTLGWLLWNFTGPVTAVVGVSARQALVPQDLQGRVVGTIRWIIFGVVPLGSLVGGGLGSVLGLRAAIGIGALIASVAFVPILVSPFRTLRGLPETSPPRAPPQETPVERRGRLDKMAAADSSERG
jgi:MFS family permease